MYNALTVPKKQIVREFLMYIEKGQHEMSQDSLHEALVKKTIRKHPKRVESDP